MANNNNVNLNLNSPTITGTTNINATGSGTTTIGNSSAGALNFASNANSSITLNNVSFSLTTGTGAINIAADAFVKTVDIGSTSTTQLTFTSGGLIIDSGSGSNGAVAITKQGTGNLAFVQSASGDLSLSSTLIVSVGNTGTPTGIDLGNASSNVAVTIGNNTGTTSVTLNTGSGTINIGTSGAKAITLGNGNTSGSMLKILTGTGGIIYQSIDVTGSSATLVPGITYTADNASLVTLTLPTTAAVGTFIRVGGNGAGGWKIAQNASQNINSTATSTTTGTGGSLSSGGQYDCVELVCGVANTSWTIKESYGTLSFV